MDRIVLRREYRALASEMGMTDQAEINAFVNAELIAHDQRQKEEEEKQRKLRMEELERQKEEEEKQRKLRMEELERQKEEEERQRRIRMEEEDRRRELRKEEDERQRLAEERQREIRKEEEESKRDTLQMQLQVERERTKQKEIEREASENSSPHTSQHSADTPFQTQRQELNLAFNMDPFNDQQDDIDEYLDRFEKMIEDTNLDRSKWSTKLASLLKGRAYQVYAQLPPNARDSYPEVRKTLLRHYEVTAFVYKQKFRTARKLRSETYSHMTDRLRFLLQKWLFMSGLEDDYEGLMELIMTEQLLDSMSAPERAFVRQNGAESLVEIAKFADRYLEAEKQGHTEKRHRPEPHRNDGKRTDKEKGKPDSRPPRSHNLPQKYCSFCKTTTHNTENCWTKGAPKKTGFGMVACQTKNSDPRPTDQTSPHHPTVGEVTVNGKVCRALYDTGLDFSCVVKADLVLPEQYTGDHIDVQYASLDFPSLRLPVANVQIEKCPFVIGTVQAGVLKEPAYDVILGCKYVFIATPTRPIIACPVMTRGQNRQQEEEALIKNPAPAELKQAQADDNSLAACYKKLPRAHNPLKKGDFVTQKGILYRVAGPDKLQLAVPQSYRNQVLNTAHDLPWSGHMGAGSTSQRVAAHYYWPGVNEDVRRYVRSCYTCQKRSARTYTVPVKLGDMPVIGTPFERVAVDIVGPLPQSKQRNRFILTLIDVCSGWAEAKPMRRIDSQSVTEALIEMFTRLGIPKQILSDNGSQFCGKLMEEVYQLLHTKHITTSVYHPQGNGQCERFNGTLIQILKKLVQDKPETWDTYVAPALYAYRDSPQERTGYAPATLIFGRPLAGPLDVLKNVWTDDSLDVTEQNASKYVHELKTRLQYSWRVATAALKKARAKQARYYNKNTKDRELEVGDQALILLPSGTNKLQISWQGPYKVTRKISRTNYSLDVQGKIRSYHINLLKKFRERPPQQHLMTMLVAEEVESTEDLALDYPLRPTETHQHVQINKNLDANKQADLTSLIKGNESCFTDCPGRTDLVEVSLTLTDPTPVRCKPYPVPLAKEHAIDEEVEAMLKAGVITPSTSPYSAPVVLLRKPSGEHRLCVDFRKLNAVTEFQPEPLPDQTRLFAKVGKAKYYSRIDLSRGFFQIPIKPEHRKFLAFSTHNGHYEFTVLPFGLHNAPSIFSRMMKKLLTPLNNENLLHFMDDILVASATWDRHLHDLKTLFTRLRQTGLTARPTKCKFGYPDLEFLGHHLSHGKIQPEEKNVDKMRDAQRPKTKKNVRSFLGMCGYYQKFIPNFNRIAAPLTNLTKKDVPDLVPWSAECETAFQTLKDKITSHPILHLPDPNKQYVLRTDASKVAIGAALLQASDSDPETLHPIAYASRKLNKAEQNYATVEQECLALVWAIQKFQIYLYGKHFRIQCDNQPMLFLASAKKLNAKLMRWSLLLQTYSYQIEFIRSHLNNMADYMSRHPAEETQPLVEHGSEKDTKVTNELTADKETDQPVDHSSLRPTNPKITQGRNRKPLGRF